MQCKKMDRFYLKLCQKKKCECRCVRMHLCWPLQCLHAELAESRSDNEFLYMLKHGMSMREALRLNLNASLVKVLKDLMM